MNKLFAPNALLNYVIVPPDAYENPPQTRDRGMILKSLLRRSCLVYLFTSYIQYRSSLHQLLILLYSSLRRFIYTFSSI